MMETIASLDNTVTLFINRAHTPWLDPIMYWVSNKFVWIPLYLLVLFFVINKWKKKAIMLILLLVISVTISDQCCNVLKKNTKRLRPSNNIELKHTIHLVQKSDGQWYHGSQYGFPSAHSANAMVFVLFTFFFAGNRKLWTMIAIFLWAALLGYSRIYLGVHYWLDVECGYVTGGLCFAAIFGINQWLKLTRIADSQ